ncbi:hypothetical protein [Polyangium sp. y55x31]|uniref:hypothetical protein n=1 Tax=Polyangium sp. y55x31 TaxID=3042688 RepID=UPI002482F48E|nr:hypothetical protein [Polyangium sp. y55x31]MDI1476960.1 hypothetical protein [Polyangium sp. y55x31]
MTTTPIQLREALRGEGDREVRTVLADERRKLVLIALRKGAVLAAHHAIHPITIHCLEGQGELRVGEEVVLMSPGVVVPLDAHVVHEVEGKPEIVLLVTMFRDKK